MTAQVQSINAENGGSRLIVDDIVRGAFHPLQTLQTAHQTGCVSQLRPGRPRAAGLLVCRWLQDAAVHPLNITAVI